LQVLQESSFVEKVRILEDTEATANKNNKLSEASLNYYNSAIMTSVEMNESRSLFATTRTTTDNRVVAITTTTTRCIERQSEVMKIFENVKPIAPYCRAKVLKEVHEYVGRKHTVPARPPHTTTLMNILSITSHANKVWFTSARGQH
jgi:hypothetical protein